MPVNMLLAIIRARSPTNATATVEQKLIEVGTVRAQCQATMLQPDRKDTSASAAGTAAYFHASG